MGLEIISSGYAKQNSGENYLKNKLFNLDGNNFATEVRVLSDRY